MDWRSKLLISKNLSHSIIFKSSSWYRDGYKIIHQWKSVPHIFANQEPLKKMTEVSHPHTFFNRILISLKKNKKNCDDLTRSLHYISYKHMKRYFTEIIENSLKMIKNIYFQVYIRTICKSEIKRFLVHDRKISL